MRDEVISLLLVVAGVCGLLFAALAAGAPFMADDAKFFGYGIFHQIDPGWLSCMMLLPIVPVPVLCLVAGAAVWFARVRRRAARAREAAAAEIRQELTLTAWLDRLGSALLAAEPAAPPRFAVPEEVRALGERRRARLFAFLCEVGLSGEAAAGTAREADQPAPEVSSLGPNRTLVVSGSGCLLVIGAFLFAWGIFTFFADTLSAPLRAFGLTQEIAPKEALLGALGCCIPALGAVLAGAGILWLFGRDRRRARRRDEELDQRRQAMLEALEDRIRDLISRSALRAASGSVLARRIARGRIMATLPELDGQRKGELLRFLVAARLLAPPAPLDLAGGDFSGSVLGGARMGGNQLAGIVLDAADLTRADLAGAELQGSRLVAADLRSCDLRGACLRHADLRRARLQRADLRGADLSQADLDQANLWGADLGGAQLVGARGTPEAAAPARPTTGAGDAPPPAGG
jgi:cytochrome c-type biogenesis protein CcmH/NrfF